MIIDSLLVDDHGQIKREFLLFWFCDPQLYCFVSPLLLNLFQVAAAGSSSH